MTEITEDTQTGAMTLPEMIAKRDALAKQIEQAQREARSGAVAKVRELMALHGLTVDDIGGKPCSAPAAEKQEKERKPAAIKYRDPDTGDTWTGRGLKPKWLTAKEAAGIAIENFKILEPA